MTRSVSSHLETAFMSQNARKHSDVSALVLYKMSCTRAGLICCGSRMVPVHISHVLVNVAKHHICSAGRTFTLGQQSCNYKIFKYSKKSLVFQNKLAKIFKVACESRQFRNPELFEYLITLKYSDLHMEDHGVTDVMDQHQGNMVCTETWTR